MRCLVRRCTYGVRCLDKLAISLRLVFGAGAGAPAVLPADKLAIGAGAPSVLPAVFGAPAVSLSMRRSIQNASY